MSDTLEDRARHTAQELDNRDWDLSVQSMVEREIALTVDQIDRFQQLHEELHRSLMQTECYIDSDLMQMEQRTPRYSPDRFPERDKLQRRLTEICRERRNLAITREERMRELHNRLLLLLNRHSQLKL